MKARATQSPNGKRKPPAKPESPRRVNRGRPVDSRGRAAYNREHDDETQARAEAGDREDGDNEARYSRRRAAVGAG